MAWWRLKFPWNYSIEVCHNVLICRPQKVSPTNKLNSIPNYIIIITAKNLPNVANRITFKWDFHRTYILWEHHKIFKVHFQHFTSASANLLRCLPDAFLHYTNDLDIFKHKQGKFTMTRFYFMCAARSLARSLRRSKTIRGSKIKKSFLFASFVFASV